MLDYKTYLQSKHWQRLRHRVLRRDHHKCRGCGTACSILGQPLHVHHEIYHLHHERMGDLVLLCNVCHSERHEVKVVANVL